MSPEEALLKYVRIIKWMPWIPKKTLELSKKKLKILGQWRSCGSFQKKMKAKFYQKYLFVILQKHTSDAGEGPRNSKHNIFQRERSVV